MPNHRFLMKISQILHCPLNSSQNSSRAEVHGDRHGVVPHPRVAQSYWRVQKVKSGLVLLV